MALNQHKRAVGVFSNRQDAEHALNELSRSGFPMNKVSVIARDADRQDGIAGVDVSDRVNNPDKGAKTGAITGGALGGITGLLVGLGSLAIPGVGPVLLAGEVASTIAATLAGGTIGAAAGGLLGALVGLGIPEERARTYNERVSRGDYLVIVDGTDTEIAIAETVLGGRGVQDWGVYDAPGAGNNRSDYVPATPLGGTTGMSVGDPLGVPPATAMGGVTGMGMMAGDPLGVSSTPMDYATTTPSYGASTFSNKRAVGVFNNRSDVEAALNELQRTGFPMDTVSVVAKDADRNDEIAGVDMSDRVGNKADEGAATGAVTGGAVGGLTGLLVGLGALAIPGIGPVMLAGATATAIATTISGGAIGAAAGSLLGALVGLGIPEERARAYNERISQGGYLVIVDGTSDDIRRAEAVLSNRGIQDWGIYDALDDGSTRAEYTDTNVSTAVNTPRKDYSDSISDTDAKVIIVDRRDER